MARMADGDDMLHSDARLGEQLPLPAAANPAAAILKRISPRVGWAIAALGVIFVATVVYQIESTRLPPQPAAEARVELRPAEAQTAAELAASFAGAREQRSQAAARVRENEENAPPPVRLSDVRRHCEAAGECAPPPHPEAAARSGEEQVREEARRRAITSPIRVPLRPAQQQPQSQAAPAAPAATAAEREHMSKDLRSRLQSEREQLSARLAALGGEEPRGSAGRSGSGQAYEGSLSEYATLGTRPAWELGHQLQSPHKYQVMAGFVLRANLIGGINSDLPGQVMAQVSENVYDTPTGKYLLIPQGSRLIGVYGSGVLFGQERVMVAWQRLIYPDGRSLDLSGMPGADRAGFAGLHDRVNNHWLKVLTSALLLSGITATVSVATASDSSDDDSTASDEFRVAMASEVGTVTTRVIEKNLNISPTLEVWPGYRLNVIVTHDLTFPGAYVRQFPVQ